jgi:hypothetical protein
MSQLPAAYPILDAVSTTFGSPSERKTNRNMTIQFKFILHVQILQYNVAMYLRRLQPAHAGCEKKETPNKYRKHYHWGLQTLLNSTRTPLAGKAQTALSSGHAHNDDYGNDDDDDVCAQVLMRCGSCL